MTWNEVAIYNMIFWPAWISLCYMPIASMQFMINNSGDKDV